MCNCGYYGGTYLADPGTCPERKHGAVEEEPCIQHMEHRTLAYGTVAYGACPERKCQIPAQTSLLRSASPSSTLLEDCTSSCIVDCYFWHSPKHPNVCKVQGDGWCWTCTKYRVMCLAKYTIHRVMCLALVVLRVNLSNCRGRQLLLNQNLRVPVLSMV